MIIKKLLYLSLALISYAAKAQEYSVTSPNQKLKLAITASKNLSYRVDFNNKTIIQPSVLELQLVNGKTFGHSAVTKKTAKSVNNEIKPLYGTSSSYKNNYNELIIDFKGGYSLALRAYNEGVAYRFIASLKDSITIKNEHFELNLDKDYSFTTLGRNKDYHGYETVYQTKTISKLDSFYACLPSVINVDNNIKVVVSETNLYSYPGMYLIKNNAKANSLIAKFPQYPLETKPGGYSNFNLHVKKTADYIAHTAGTRTFPWRVISITDDEKSLLNNPIVYLLADESAKDDYSWVKPGKVAWDWWNANTLQGVDFKSGVNTETYKYFIDFAAKNGIEYVNLDEGWSDQFNLFKLSDKINMPEIIAYARQKNVKLILWMVWYTLDRQLPEALDQFQKWNIAGIKVDFMDRDDQPVMEFYERVAREAAKRKLLVNFHGACKPTGLERKYPNVINYEAVYGLEQSKWDTVKPNHDTHLPFLRNFAGPMDYTPGATRNASIENFRPVYQRPMSMGTRCHELAKFVCFYAPLQMLADSPTDYEKETDMLNFLSQVPTVWDETIPLEGKLGEYLAVARRKGNTWYIAALTNEKSKEFDLSLPFLKGNQYTITYFEDGINADRVGTDYKKKTEVMTINQATVSDTNLPSANKTLHVKMQPGGGFVAVLKNEN
ncbi:Retaining alpha-galactosidase precursor [compost metagenome]